MRARASSITLAVAVGLCGCQQILGFQDTTVGSEEVDAGGTVDAAPDDAMIEQNRCDGFEATEDVCDPLIQTGCGDGEKCTAIHPADGQGALITRCVPDGPVADGELCSVPSDGSGGIDSCRGDGSLVDDCAAGLLCQSRDGEARCTPVCATDTSGACPAGTAGARTCVALAGFFDDAPNSAGACFPQCAPVSDGLVGRPNDTCAEDETCVLLASSKEFTCVSVAEGAADLVAFDECQPQPSPGTCFLNSAPQGAVVLVRLDLGGSGTAIVTPWCKPLSTHSEVDPNAAVRAELSNGDENVLACSAGNLESASGQCRYISSMFSDLAEVPEDVGICVPFSVGQGWLDSTQFDLDEWAADPMNLPVCPGCLTNQEFQDAIDAAGGNAVGSPVTMDDVRARLPKASPALRAELERYLKTRDASTR